ncbi:haloacid dehalogenase type II [Phycicoccus sp. 3266]|uniref:haloacid dehalogenase type II n=1 Tax=Phycicoccus sp. 3266 TaxID=2817751 RepID=UPI00285A11A1|nr:2-haloacid dehalogenase [Phycicoccus sp. 3266]
MHNTDDSQTFQHRPQLVVFDVNETLSDMSGMAEAFEQTGAPPTLAATWFASLLRDGFALTVVGANPDFAALARTSLSRVLVAQGLPNVDAATERVMGAFTSLPVHDDVVPAVRALASAGIRLVTLSNGSAAVAQGLLERNGIADAFEQLLSVQDAPAWKPARAAYEYALDQCGVVARDAMLVAVHPWDIHGARQVGMATAFIDRSGASYPDHFDAPDMHVQSLVELAGTIARG